MRAVVVTFVVAALCACGKPAQPTTACTGPDFDAKKTPALERLPFHADGLDASCQAGPTISDAPAKATDVRAQVVASFEDLGTALHCDQAPQSLDVDFTHEEVVVLGFADLAHIDGTFDGGSGTVIIAASADVTCGGAPAHPAFQRALSVLERTGDTDVVVRNCVTAEPCVAK